MKIEDDIKSVQRFEPIVDKILKMRNEFLVHRSINIVATRRINLLPEIRNEEVSSMLDVLFGVATKYAMLYGQNRTMRMMVGSCNAPHSFPSNVSSYFPAEFSD